VTENPIFKFRSIHKIQAEAFSTENKISFEKALFRIHIQKRIFSRRIVDFSRNFVIVLFNFNLNGNTNRLLTRPLALKGMEWSKGSPPSVRF
jgi:hypothetical protein